MKRLLIPLFLVLTFSITASAQTYIITGSATYSDNSQLVLQDISIDCESGENGCLQFQGTTTQTDRYGNYTLAFSVVCITTLILQILGKISAAPPIIGTGIVAILSFFSWRSLAKKSEQN